MKNIVNSYVEKFKANHRKSRRMASLLLILALVVAAGVFWQLHSTGIALTNETYCGLEEHTHSADCYEEVLVCGLEESEGHTHSESCYETKQVLICGQEESEEHTHSESCYETQQVLVCGLEESEGHTHSEDCYETQLVCGLEEHTHTIECMSDDEIVLTQQTLRAETDGTIITVSGLLPEGAEVTAESVNSEDVEIEDRSVLLAYDISILCKYEDGSEIIFEPEDETVTVTIENSDFTGDSEVYYVPEEGTPEKLETAEALEGTVAFEAEHFSVYAVTSSDTIEATGTITDEDGNLITWTVYKDTESGERTLVISGTGKIPDYTSGTNTPWYSYCNTTANTLKLVIEDGITEIGAYAFHQSYISEVSFPDTLTSIGNYAFCYSRSLTSVVIPDSVTYIGASAFQYSHLEEIDLGNGVQTIGSFAFYATYSGSGITIYIPDSLTSLGTDAFNQACAYEVSDSNTNYKVIDGVLYSYDGTTLIDFPKYKVLDTYTVPSEVTKISTGALRYVLYVNSLVINHEVTFENSGYSMSNSNYQSIYLADGIEITGNAAFLSDTNLTEIRLPEETRFTMNVSCLGGDSSLTYLKIPDGTTSLQNQSLSGLTGLETLYYDAANASAITSNVFGGTSGISYDLIVGTNVDTLPAGFNYLVVNANEISFEGPNAIYVTAGALDSAPSPLTAVSGWIYVDEYGAVYQLDVDNGTAALIYVPDSYVDTYGDTQTLTEYTVPSSFTVSGESDSTVNKKYNVTSVGSNALKYADNLTGITFEDVSGVTLEAYALAGCETLKSVTDSKTGMTVTTVENAEKLGFSVVGTNAFYNTGLTTDTPVLSEDTMDGSSTISTDIKNADNTAVSTMTVTVSSSGAGTWTAEQGKETGGYVALTGEEVVVSTTVSNTSGSAQTYRLYLTSTDEDFSVNHGPGTTFTSGGITITCVQDPDDPYSFYYEFTLTEQQTLSLDLTCSYPNGSDGGGLTISCAIMETTTVNGETTVTGTKSESENELQIWWKTEQDDYTLAKTNGSQSSVEIKSDENGAYLASGLQYTITLTQDEDKNSSLGEDYVTSVEYSDVITLPDGVTWDADVLEAIRNGSYTRSTGNTTTFSVNGTTIVTLKMTSDSGLVLQKAVLSVNDSGQVVLTWTVKNTGTANLANNSFTLTVASAALDIILSSDDPTVKVFDADAENKVSNTVSSTVHYTFGDDVPSNASADKELTIKEGTVAVSKQAVNSAAYLGEDLTYEVSVYNDGATDYTYNSDNLTGSYTYSDTLPDAVYISASNMESMFQDAEEMGTPLTVTITGAILGVNDTAADADGSGNTAYLNSGNTSSDTETAGNTITITCKRSGSEEPYTYTYYVSVKDTNGSETAYSGTDLEALLQGIGYGVTRSAVYTCTWTLDDQTSVNVDKNVLTIKAGETLTWSILSTVKSTFQYLQDSDWPNEYPKDTAVTFQNNGAYLYDPSGKQITKTGSVSSSVKRESWIGKSVYDSEGNQLDSSVSAEDGDALTYELTFTHYGDGSYDDLAMVDDLYGSQYLLVPVSLNGSNSSITDYIWTPTATEPTWSGAGVTKVTIGEGADAVEYYVLGSGTYTNVAVGTYTKSDGTTGTLIASTITVSLDDNETDVTIGETAYTYSGVHTEIDWYFDELDGGNYTITVDYQALVVYGDQPNYTLGNVVWMNDRTGSRIYDSLWGGGTIINYEKDIVTSREDQDDPEKDEIEEDDQSEVGKGETVTYRLKLYSTGDAGAAFTLTGANIADALPETYETFAWSKDNVKITDVVAVPADSSDPDNCVTGYESLSTDANWTIDSSWNGLTSAGQYYIIWNDDVSLTFTGNAAVYVYVELTFPENGVSVQTAGGGTETVDQWDNYVAAVGGTIVSNTFYVYRNPSTVTHILKEDGSAALTKGVYTLAQSSSSIKETSGNINLYPSGSSRENYNNEDSVYRYVWYYVELYNDAYSRLYINDLYDTLPEGFTYVMMGATGDIRSDGRLAYISAKSDRGTTVSSADTNANHWLIEQETGVTYMSASVTAQVSGDGTLIFTIGAGDGGTYSIKYDEDAGQYYLDHGESIVFGYICQIDTYANTEDNAKNTIAMSYTNYNNADGVNAAENHSVSGKDFSVDGGITRWYNGNTNDGSTTVQNSSEISYDDGTGNENWLVSSVTVSRGNIVPGAAKQTVGYRYVTNSDKTVQTYENSVNAGAVIYWEATLSNSGTMAIYDYTVTDVMPEPYVFTEDVTYTIVDSTGKTTDSGNLFTFPDAEDVDSLSDGDTVEISYEGSKGTTAALVTVGGNAVTIPGVNGEFTVKLSLSDGDVVLEIGFTDTVWSIPEGGYLTLGYASYNPTGNYQNKTYLNSVTLTPVLQDFDYVQSGKITSDGSGVYATSAVTVSTGSSTSAWKTVQEKGSSFAAVSGEEENSIVLSSQDSIFTYTLSVKNDSTDYAMTELVVIDNLPAVGDHMTYDTTDRGSEFAVQLADAPNFQIVITSPKEIDSSLLTCQGTSTTTDEKGNAVTTYIYSLDADAYQASEPAAGTDIYYTIEYSKISIADYFTAVEDEHGVVSLNDKWINDSVYATDSDGGTIDTVTAIQIIIKDSTGTIIPAGATVSISFDAQVKTDETTGEYPDPGLTAWNNFGYDYTMNVSGSSEIWLSAMPLEVGVQVPSAPKLEKKLVDLDGNSYTASEDTEFSFIVYEDSGDNSYESLEALKSALDARGIKYKEFKVTVEEGNSDSGYLSLGGSEWSGWTWTQGQIYTIAEYPDNDTYTFKSWGAANGTSGDTANGSSYTFTYDRDKTLYLTASNTCNVWDLTLTKVDADSYDDTAEDYTTMLKGAVFALYTKDSDKQIADADYDALSVQPEKQITVGEGSKAVVWYLYSVQTTDDDGKITWTNLTQDSYYLVEVKAPDGYNLSYSSHEVSRTSNSVSVTATNTAGYELPNSGGMGTGMYTVMGLAMCAAAGLLFFLGRRRRIHV